MTTLAQTQLEKETIFIEGTAIEVDLALTDWQAYYSDRSTVTMLADLYSVAEESTRLIPDCG